MLFDRGIFLEQYPIRLVDDPVRLSGMLTYQRLLFYSPWSGNYGRESYLQCLHNGFFIVDILRLTRGNEEEITTLC